MLLTQNELKSLVEVRNGSPHQLLGLHALGDDTGLVGRALLPDAAQAQIEQGLREPKGASPLPQAEAAAAADAAAHTDATAHAATHVDKG